MSWCDPCAANPLTPEELRGAGVFWLDGPGRNGNPDSNQGSRRVAPLPAGASQAMLTRLHVRYTPDTFPEDLSFQETRDRANFQARYVLRHPWNGSVNECPQAQAYFQQLNRRQENEARQLATLTNWEMAGIRSRMDLRPLGRNAEGTQESWWPWKN
jgi:hypothetical protein